MMFDMRKASTLAAAGALAASIALVGCGGQPASSGSAGGDTKTENATANDGSSSGSQSSSSSTDGSSTGTSSTTVQWADAASAQEACEKAKLAGDFVVPDSLKASGIDFSGPKFSYMPAIVKATYEQPASMVEIRKGIGPAGTVREDDGTGYMGEAFPEHWEVTTPEGKRINCYGNKKGEIIFAQWYDDSAVPDQAPVTLNGHTAGDTTRDGQSDAYSVHAMGLGGEDIPMTESEFLAIVAAVK